MQAIYDFFLTIYNGSKAYLSEFATYLGNIFTVIGYDALDAIIKVVKSLVITLLSGLTVVDDFVSSWNALPPDVLYAINAVNLPSALAVLLGAYLLRFAITLIPFVGN